MILVGALAWTALDHFQSRKLQAIFNSRLDAALLAQAMEDRGFFDKYIRSYTHTIRLLAGQKRLLDYLESSNWSSATKETIRYRRLPPWLPPSSVLRTLPRIRFFQLLDLDGRVRELFSERANLPDALKNPSNLLVQLSHNQTYLTTIDNGPYVVSSQIVGQGEGGSNRAIFLLATPIDGEFLLSALNSLRRHNLVALVDSVTNKIIASSDPREIPDGSGVDALSKTFVITGKSYFDYGSADIQAYFISLLPRSQYDAVSRDLLRADRLNRAITGLVLLVCIIVVILYIVGKINTLTASIDAFAVEKLGVKPHVRGGGDQLYLLENRFGALTKEVVDAQDRLKCEAEKNILLVQQNFEMEERQKLLELLEAVTEELGIGVIIENHVRKRAAVNAKMEKFADRFGGLDRFVTVAEADGLVRMEIAGQDHFFLITKPEFPGFEDDIILVQEITERKKAENEREQLIAELQDALSKVKTLSGFLPICASCKKIRDDQGYWDQIESYISKHSDALFSHGICPDCLKKLYPDFTLPDK